MSNGLKASQVERYFREGFLYPVPALHPDEADAAFRALEKYEGESGEKASNTMRGKGHLKLMALYELTRHPAILDAVELIIGPDILCWNSSIFMKDANDPSYVAWHQDNYAFGEHSEGVVNAWVALRPSTIANGAMKVIPKSHHHKAMPHTKTPDGAPTMLRDRSEIAVEIDEREAEDLVLAQGEMSLHHMYIHHGSPPNRSNERRCGFAIRYVAPHVCPPGTSYAATVVRGVDFLGRFGRDPVPARDLDPEIVAYVERYGRPRLP